MDFAMKHSISVVLPNYNGRNLLLENLPSIVNSLENTKSDFEIIVVDDSSTDDSVNLLKKEFPFVKVIINEINQGFSATCNRGIHTAKNDLLCLINTDVAVDINYFKNAFKYFTGDNLFAIKGDIINYDTTFDNVIDIQKTSQLCIKRGFLKSDQKIKHIAPKLSGLVGGQLVYLGCVFVCDRVKMLDLNGFDEIFSPYYWEDFDLGLRALRSGYDVVYAPECFVYHKTSSTLSKYASKTKKKLISNRNKFLFSWKHLQGIQQWSAHIFFTIIGLLTRWILLDWKYYFAFFSALYRKSTFTA